MREGWEVKKLGDVCDLQNGFAFKSKTYVEYSDVLNIRMSNIRPDGTFNPEHNIRYLPSNYKEEYKQYILNENDLVIAMTDMAGDPKILGLPTLVSSLNGRTFLLNQRVGKLMNFQSNIFIPYLRYYLSSEKMKNYYKSKGAGGLQLNISKKDILTAEIPIPPLPEQKQIVKTLDLAFGQIDQAKANLEQNLANAKELFASKLNEVFSQRGEGWEEKNWKEVLDIRSGRNQKEVENPNGKYPILGSAGKVMGYADKYLCDEGTTIVGRKGTIDKPLYIETKFWNVDTAFGLIVGDLLEKKYLYYFCKGFNFKDLDKGTTLPSLVKKDLVKIKMIIPPKVEQVKIIELIDKLENQMNTLETHYQQNLNNLEELKKSILEKAFRGELV